MWFTNVFSQSVTNGFILLTGCFKLWNCKSWRHPICHFFLIDCIFGVNQRICLPGKLVLGSRYFIFFFPKVLRFYTLLVNPWCVLGCCVLRLSLVFDSLWLPWTIAHRAPLFMEILQARTLEWVAIHSRLILYKTCGLGQVHFGYAVIHLEKGMAPHSSTLDWKIPWMEEPGRLQSMGSLGVGHDWATLLSLFTFMHWKRKWQPTPVFLPGESQGRGSLVACRLWGRTESDTTEAT